MLQLRAIPTLILSSHASDAFGRGIRLERIAHRGALERVARGAYVDSVLWTAQTPTERYCSRVTASALARGGHAVISHQSAAAFWGLPTMFGWPSDVHFTVDRATGGRSVPGVRKHAVGLDGCDVVEHGGLLITSLPRTLVDIAAAASPIYSVAMLDRALATDPFGRFRPAVTKDDLLDALERALPLRGSVRAGSSIAFATPLSGSPSESWSRVTMALAGFPTPILQHEFWIERLRYWTDFFWEELCAIGECDGKQKYFDPAMTAGRTSQQIFWSEKQREDRLRSHVRAFARWDASVAVNQTLLTARLLALGLRPGQSALRVLQPATR